jgi:hypothetical protein
MKTSILKKASLTLFSAALLALTSCSTPEGTEVVTTIETPDGAIIVDKLTTTATVTAMDPVKRKLTLALPGGGKTTYKAGPEVVNFAQIQVGDRVKATVTEEVAVFIGDSAPPAAMAGQGVALAPVGDKPGGIMVDTALLAVNVTAVDAKKHKVSLQLPDGTVKKVKVGKKVDLSTLRPGDHVMVQMGEGLAISVEQP